MKRRKDFLHERVETRTYVGKAECNIMDSMVMLSQFTRVIHGATYRCNMPVAILIPLLLLPTPNASLNDASQ